MFREGHMITKQQYLDIIQRLRGVEQALTEPGTNYALLSVHISKLTILNTAAYVDDIRIATPGRESHPDDAREAGERVTANCAG